MPTLDALINQSAQITVKTVIKTIAACVLAGLMSLILWITLLPQFSICGESLSSCIALGFIIVYLALVCPFLLLWCGRGYVLLKVSHDLFTLFERPLVELCAQQIFKHRISILKLGKIDTRKWETNIPFIIRSIINRLEVKSLKPLLEKPDLKPAELIGPLSQKLEAQINFKKPSFVWYWLILGSMFGSAAVVWFVL